MSAAGVSVALVRRRPPARVRQKRLLLAVANHSLLVAAAIAFLAPIAFILLTSLMTNRRCMTPLKAKRKILCSIHARHLLPAAVAYLFRWATFACMKKFIVILIGAELDAEMEHQTARDTTTGSPKPMGTRGARMADTVGPARS